MTTDGYGYTGTTQDQYYSDGLQDDVPLYQTPKRALAHPHFIGGLIIGAIGGFLINWGIGALTMIGKDRLFLWSSIKPYTLGTDDIKPATAIWIELLLTITLSVFLGSPINYLFAKGDIRKGKAVLIQGHDLQKFRFLGVTLQNCWARAFVWTIFSTMIIFPTMLLILHLACSHGGMYTAPVPPDFLTPGECYMTKKYYILLKGISAALAGLVVSWLAEWGSLNKDNLPEELVHEYQATKSHNDKMSAL
jgi:hypothetical protein